MIEQEARLTIRKLVSILNKIEGLARPLNRGRALDIETVEGIVDAVMERFCAEVEVLGPEALEVSVGALSATIWYHPQLDGWVVDFE